MGGTIPLAGSSGYTRVLAEHESVRMTQSGPESCIPPWFIVQILFDFRTLVLLFMVTEIKLEQISIMES